MPTAYKPAWIDMSVDAWSNQQQGSDANLDQQLRMDMTTDSMMLAAMSLTFTPTNGQVNLNIEDPSHRYFYTQWELR